MNELEKMAADIALTMNGGEWTDGKWYSKGHREAWIKAVKPYADEIERLREENDTLKATVINLLAKEFEHVKVFKPKPKKSRSALQQKESE